MEEEWDRVQQIVIVVVGLADAVAAVVCLAEEGVALVDDGVQGAVDVEEDGVALEDADLVDDHVVRAPALNATRDCELSSQLEGRRNL